MPRATFVTAIEIYEQVLVIDREIADRQGECVSLGSLGNAYADLGDARKAIEYFEQALAISREIGNRRGEGIVLWNSALSYDALGNRAEAIARAGGGRDLRGHRSSEHREGASEAGGMA